MGERRRSIHDPPIPRLPLAVNHSRRLPHASNHVLAYWLQGCYGGEAEDAPHWCLRLQNEKYMPPVVMYILLHKQLPIICRSSHLAGGTRWYLPCATRTRTAWELK